MAIPKRQLTMDADGAIKIARVTGQAGGSRCGGTNHDAENLGMTSPSIVMGGYTPTVTTRGTPSTYNRSNRADSEQRKSSPSLSPTRHMMEAARDPPLPPVPGLPDGQSNYYGTVNDLPDTIPLPPLDVADDLLTDLLRGKTGGAKTELRAKDYSSDEIHSARSSEGDESYNTNEIKRSKPKSFSDRPNYCETNAKKAKRQRRWRSGGKRPLSITAKPVSKASTERSPAGIQPPTIEEHITAEDGAPVDEQHDPLISKPLPVTKESRTTGSTVAKSKTRRVAKKSFLENKSISINSIDGRTDPIRNTQSKQPKEPKPAPTGHGKFTLTPADTSTDSRIVPQVQTDIFDLEGSSDPSPKQRQAFRANNRAISKESRTRGATNNQKNQPRQRRNGKGAHVSNTAAKKVVTKAKQLTDVTKIPTEEHQQLLDVRSKAQLPAPGENPRHSNAWTHPNSKKKRAPEAFQSTTQALPILKQFSPSEPKSLVDIVHFDRHLGPIRDLDHEKIQHTNDQLPREDEGAVIAGDAGLDTPLYNVPKSSHGDHRIGVDRMEDLKAISDEAHSICPQNSFKSFGKKSPSRKHAREEDKQSPPPPAKKQKPPVNRESSTQSIQQPPAPKPRRYITVSDTGSPIALEALGNNQHQSGHLTRFSEPYDTGMIDATPDKAKAEIKTIKKEQSQGHVGNYKGLVNENNITTPLLRIETPVPSRGCRAGIIEISDTSDSSDYESSIELRQDNCSLSLETRRSVTLSAHQRQHAQPSVQASVRDAAIHSTFRSPKKTASLFSRIVGNTASTEQHDSKNDNGQADAYGRILGAKLIAKLPREQGNDDAEVPTPIFNESHTFLKDVPRKDGSGRCQVSVEQASHGVAESMHAIVDTILHKFKSQEKVLPRIIDEYSSNGRRLTEALLARQAQEREQATVDFGGTCKDIFKRYNKLSRMTKKIRESFSSERSQAMQAVEQVEQRMQKFRATFQTAKDSLEA
ncbi:hypothetical protein BX600DRAFT_556286 [Xylariales sp. PMI_506]|nr:hypothetical protein BX600DRAFT_556286 [Xylariales sp. PMI_506]